MYFWLFETHKVKIALEGVAKELKLVRTVMITDYLNHKILLLFVEHTTRHRLSKHILNVNEDYYWCFTVFVVFVDLLCWIFNYIWSYVYDSWKL